MRSATTLPMNANTQVIIYTDDDHTVGQGTFPKAKDEKVSLFGEHNRDHIQGFVSEDTNVGELVKIEDGQKVKVLYKHKKDRENRIYFFTANDEIHVINVINVPIHDHSSIHQGGPAYGTYYFDEKPDEEEEGEGEGAAE